MTTKHLRLAHGKALTIGTFVLLLFAVRALRASDLFNNFNTSAVTNVPSAPTTFTLASAAHVTQLVTYHWNRGQGSPPGSIALRSTSGQLYGPYPAHGNATGRLASVDWIADLNLTLPAGTYSVIDSYGVTWSQNAQSGGRGFAIVRGTLGSGTPAPISSFDPGTAPKYPSPCRYTTGATLEMLNTGNTRCQGPPGSVIEIEVATSLSSVLRMVSFEPPPRNQSNIPSFAQTPPLNVPAVMAPAQMGPNTAPGTHFDGLNRGSLYVVTVPQSLCLGRRKVSIAWNAFGFTASGPVKGPPIDWFLVTCP